MLIILEPKVEEIDAAIRRFRALTEEVISKLEWFHDENHRQAKSDVNLLQQRYYPT